jgi:hypothetical protein
MRAAAPPPDPQDKDALRRWMRENRRTRTGPDVPAGTPHEFAAGQRRRLLQNFGAVEETSTGQRLEVALTGEATMQHRVHLSVLGPFLVNLQESVSAVAQALTGRPTSRAAIPGFIRELTALSALATFPSSFGVALQGPEPERAEDDLFPEIRGDLRTVLDDAVEAVLDVVDLSEGVGGSDDLLVERLVPLGQRAMKHLGALTAGLADAQLGLSLAWRSQAGGTRHGQWTPCGAQRVRYLCEHSDFDDSETVRIVGFLGGASTLRATVEIRADSGEIIRARSDEDVTPRLSEFFGNRVEAEVEVTNVRSTGGRERKIYVVLALRNV